MRTVLTLVVLCFALGVARAQDNFPDVPESHAAYRVFLRLRQQGFGVEEAWPFSDRPPSSKELAKKLIRYVDQLPLSWQS